VNRISRGFQVTYYGHYKRGVWALTGVTAKKVNRFRFFCLTQTAIRCLLGFFRVKEFLWRGFFGQKFSEVEAGLIPEFPVAVLIRLNP